jgi:hypothetical protein
MKDSTKVIIASVVLFFLGQATAALVIWYFFS